MPRGSKKSYPKKQNRGGKKSGSDRKKPSSKSSSLKKANPVEAGINKSEKTKVRYALIALGHISQIAVLPGFEKAKNAELVALVSGDPQKLSTLGKEYSVKRLLSYDQYDELLDSEDIDAVYISLPNDMHFEFARKALEAGIHVLCEKPLTLKAEQAAELQSLAEDNNVKMMTAYRLHFDPANLRAIELISSGKIGEPKIFSSTFSFQIKDENNIRLKEERGGGPLFDLGIYCINAARYLFREEPTEVFGVELKNTDPRFEEVEESLAAVLKFKDQRLAQFTCSFGAYESSDLEVIGTKGRLCISSAYEYSEEMSLDYENEKETKTEKFSKHDQFYPEIKYFSDCILNDQEPEPSALEGYLDVRIMEALKESVRTGMRIELDDMSEAKKARPSIKQSQPVESLPSKPKTFKVKSASG